MYGKKAVAFFHVHSFIACWAMRVLPPKVTGLNGRGSYRGMGPGVSVEMADQFEAETGGVGRRRIPLDFYIFLC